MTARPRDINFKATPLSNSPHIIYDGLSSRMFGIRNVQPANGLAEDMFLSNSTLVTDKSRYNDRVYLLGINREPLKFSMRLLFDPHTFDERKLQEVKKWLYQDTYKEFRYDSGQEQDLDIWVYAICTGESNVRHNAVDDAYIDFTFETNAPYRFSQVMEDEFDFSITNTQKMKREFTEGFDEATKSIEGLTSRLRQSIRNTEDMSNDYPEYYRQLLKDFIEGVRFAKSHIDEPFGELMKVDSVDKTYYSQWSIQRDVINDALINLEISEDRINNLDDGYLSGTANLYAKAISKENRRLHVDGDETYSENHKSSGFITKVGDKYTWHSKRNIQDPVIQYYNDSREYIHGEELSAGSSIVLADFPENTAYFRISAKTSINDDSTWKVELGEETNYTSSPLDLFPELRESVIVQNVNSLNRILRAIDLLEDNILPYIKNIEKDIDNTLELYPDIVEVYNFGDLPCKPVIELEVADPFDIRIENVDTGESTTITDNVAGEVITLKNETEQIETSRTSITGQYYKYDAHDDNFITLREFENRLQFFGSYKVKITYQFKIL